MREQPINRIDECPSCAMPAAGNLARCIFCGHTLMIQTVAHWRTVYHPHSYADAMLATATLKAHGCTTRLRHTNVERIFLGHVGSSVEVASDEHLLAKEVLRQLRGVRTDTEYLEWQELKAGRRRKRGMAVAAVALVTVTAALAASVAWSVLMNERGDTPRPVQTRP